MPNKNAFKLFEVCQLGETTINTRINEAISNKNIIIIFFDGNKLIDLIGFSLPSLDTYKTHGYKNNREILSSMLTNS